MSETIKCDCCQKDSGIEASENIGTNGARVYRLGWIFKNLLLYTGKSSDTYIVCSKECSVKLRDKIFTREKVSDKKKEEVSAYMEEAKKRIPKMAEETTEVISKFTELINSLPKKK